MDDRGLMEVIASMVVFQKNIGIWSYFLIQSSNKSWFILALKKFQRKFRLEISV